MKKIFYASFIAVLTGVVLLGVNAAFGANTPSVAPENADLVSPVFGGLDVRGKIRNTSGVDGPQGDGAVVIDDDFGVQNNLIVGKEGLFAGNLQTFGDLTVGSAKVESGTLIVKNKILNDELDNFGNSPLQIDDLLDVTNDTRINGDFTIGYTNPEILRNVTINANSTTKGSLSVGGTLTAKSNLDAQAGIENTIQIWSGSAWVDQPVTIDDDADVNGNLEATGNVGGYNLSAENNLAVSQTAALNNVTMYGTLKNTYQIGGNQPVKIDDSLQVSAKLDVIGKTNTAGGLLVNNGLTVSGDAAFADNVNVTGTISNPNALTPVTIGSDLDINGSMSTTGNVYINGTVVAEKFGNYFKRASGWFKFDVNTGTKTVACNPGEVIISCGVDTWDNLQDAEINELDFNTATNSCTANVTNKSASTSRWFSTTALCFNSGL